ncbi:MAG: hypothetical protein QGG62_04600, partial [Candidatus Poseidoniaceae archaeon]|nr:hypothetical protein [Candidatus Poseidoniaceae archaeon]
LEDIDYVDVLVVGRYITPGNKPGTLGIDGDQVGFGLAIRGVELDPLNHSDGDGDGITYEQDLCPFTNAFGWDMDDDGCIDDTDIDGVEDDVDACPMTPEQVPVDEVGCAEQNEAPRIFLDESLLLSHDNETITILFSVLDEDNVEVAVLLERAGSPVSSVDVCLEIITNDSWRSCSVNTSQDFFPLDAVGNWTAYLVAEDLNTSSWTMPAIASYRSGTFTIHPIEPVSETYSSSNSWFTAAILTSLISAIILAFVIQLWFNQKNKEENL